MLSHCRCPEAKTIVACPALPKGGEILKEKLKQEREYWSLYVGHHKAHQLHQGELPHIEPVPPQVSQVLPASARQEKKIRLSASFFVEFCLFFCELFSQKGHFH